MISHTLRVALLLAAWTGGAGYTEKDVVRYGKALDVARLDPVLHSQRLDEWLRSGPAHLDIVQFHMSDCGVKPDPGNRDYDGPLCLRFNFARGSVGGWGNITVGTLRKGISGVAQLRDLQVVPSTNQEGVGHSSERLSDLPRLMDEGAAYKIRSKSE